MKNMCESCGMPIKKDKDKGTKADGALSTYYCKYCYENGAFKHPDATVDEMRKYSIDGMRSNGTPKWLAKFMTMGIYRLPRWKQADSSKPAE